MKSNLEVVRAFVQACNDGDLEAVMALCDPEFTLAEAKALPGSVTARGSDEARHYFERFTTHWTEMEWVPEEFIESGDRIFMRARLRLRGRRSGIEVDREWIYVFTLRDGKLLRQDGFDSRAEGLQAAGIATEPAD